MPLQVGRGNPVWQPEAHSLEQRGQEEEKLQPGQRFADADPRSRPKRQEAGGCGALTFVVKETTYVRRREKGLNGVSVGFVLIDLLGFPESHLGWTGPVCPRTGGRGESTTCWPKPESRGARRDRRCWERKRVFRKLFELFKVAPCERTYLLSVMAVCGIRTGLTGRILMPSLMTQSR